MSTAMIAITITIITIVVMIVLMLMLMLMLVAHVVYVLLVLYAGTLDLATLFVHTVLRSVDVVVPALRYEVHGSAAGIVFAAMLRPVLLVSRGDVEIERLGRRDTHDDACRHRNDRTWHDQLGRRHVPENDLAIQARGGHIQRDTYVTRLSKRRGAEGSKTGERARQIRNFSFHETSKHEPVRPLGYVA